MDEKWSSLQWEHPNNARSAMWVAMTVMPSGREACSWAGPLLRRVDQQRAMRHAISVTKWGAHLDRRDHALGQGVYESIFHAVRWGRPTWSWWFSKVIASSLLRWLSTDCPETDWIIFDLKNKPIIPVSTRTDSLDRNTLISWRPVQKTSFHND